VVAAFFIWNLVLIIDTPRSDIDGCYAFSENHSQLQ